MKHPCPFEVAHLRRWYWKFLFLALALSATGVQSDSDLKNRWSLPDVPHSFEFSDDSAKGLDFVFIYPISREVATADNIDVSLYDKGCKYNDGEPPVELLKGTTEEIVFPASIETSTAPTVMTSVKVILGSGDGMNVASLLQKYPSLWDKGQSRISFCVRFSLKTEAFEVNFVESVVNLDVVMEGVGFKITKANVQPKEKIESIFSVSYGVTAYLCDGRYKPMHKEVTKMVERLYEICNKETGEMETVSEFVETTTTVTEEGQMYFQELSEAQKAEQEKVIYMQGSVVRVCIRPDDTALGEVSMRTIEEMVFQGTVYPIVAENMVDAPPTTYVDREKGIYTQVAVQNGSTEPVSSGLSILSCEKNRLEDKPDVVVCAVDTLLVADFYWRTPGMVAEVICYGNAALQFGTHDHERKLRRAAVARANAMPHLAIEGSRRTAEAEAEGEGVPLDVYWNMTRPKVDYPAIHEATGGFNFRMNYTVSDAISNEMINMEIWKKSCQKIGHQPEMKYSNKKQTPSDLLEITSSDAYETGDGSGNQTITINGRWKREKPGFSGRLVQSPYYKETEDGTLVQISMCVRYQLHTRPQHGAIEVNFLETPIIINIDMVAGIKFGIQFDLISEDDDCLKEFDNELQEMSGGREDINDLFSKGLYWSPGSESADPTMPMGHPFLGSPFDYHAGGAESYNGGGGNPFTATNSASYHYQKRISSANTARPSRTMTVTIGIFSFFLLVDMTIIHLLWFKLDTFLQ